MQDDSIEEGMFTPLMPDGSRVKFELSPDDRKLIGRGQPWVAVVTDLKTGRHYEVEGAACGGGCFCDARVVQEVSSRHLSDVSKERTLKALIYSLECDISHMQRILKSFDREPVIRTKDGKEVDVTHIFRAGHEHHLSVLRAEKCSARKSLATLQESIGLSKGTGIRSASTPPKE